MGGGHLTATLIALAGAGAAAWFAYFRWKDRHRPEPFLVLLVTGAAGLLAVGAAAIGYEVLETVGEAPTWQGLGGTWGGAIRDAVAIGFVEESAKFIPVAVIALSSRHFDELWDGPVYAGVVGVGFALAETTALFLGGTGGVLESAARALVAPITHGLFAAPAGLGLAYAVLLRNYVALGFGFVVSVLLHAAYDLFLARPGGRLAAAAVVFAVWLWFLVVAPKLVRVPAMPRK